MAGEQSWLPETVKNLLERSEAHYRAVGFKRCAHHMKATLSSAVGEAMIPSDFYPRYVSLLKDDSKEFIMGLGFPERITDPFVRSMHRSIDLVAQVMSELDTASKTPTFSGSTSRKDDADAVNSYLSEHGLFDPVAEAEDPLGALELADPFYEMVHDHVFMPGRNYLIVQLELAAGRERMEQAADEILSVDRAIRERGEVYSDFRYAFSHPGDMTDDGKWRVIEGFDVPVDYFARWALFMYYKVPIITAMLPVHNIIFFSLVQDRIAEQRRAGVQPRH